MLIQGDPTIFSAGNDIGDFLNGPPSTEESPVFRFLRGIATFPKPIVAAVCGPAVGIGTTMLFHCDLVYAGDNAAFSMPFVNLGLCPEAASSLLVPQMLGYHRAAEALLLGEPFMAEAALEVGLVNRVVPPTEANAIAQTQARKLAAKPLSALVETKRLLKKAQMPAVLERMGEEGASFGRCCASRRHARLSVLSWRNASRTSPRSDAFSGLARVHWPPCKFQRQERSQRPSSGRMMLLKKVAIDLARRRTFGLLAVALAAPSLALARVRPLRIGVIGSWSGPYAGGGRQFDAGMAVWLAAHNQNIAGRPVELLRRDVPGSAPEQARRHAQDLVESERVDMLAGLDFSSTPTPSAPSPRRPSCPWW